MVNKELRFLIIGGAGFIGSNIVNKLVEKKMKVIVIDDLSSGKFNFISRFDKNKDFLFINDDILNWEKYKFYLKNLDVVIHLASNADISAADLDPTVDFFKGTLLTQYAAELARILQVKQFFYASGSGVYGDYGNKNLQESTQDLKPISPYGASKLSGEAILRAYSHMFGIQVYCLRFGNVVGSNQTHGVGFDFFNKLKSDAKFLNVLGDGNQTKSYIHVSDVIEAILLLHDLDMKGFNVFNVATLDTLKVSEIVDLTLEILSLKQNDIKIIYQNKKYGWKGDVPVVKLDSTKLRRLGWSSRLNSKEAMLQALNSLLEKN